MMAAWMVMMEKQLCWGSMAVGGVVLVLFLADLALPGKFAPLGREN